MQPFIFLLLLSLFLQHINILDCKRIKQFHFHTMTDFSNKSTDADNSSSNTSTHPSRLVEFKDEDSMMRGMKQYLIQTNIRMNSIQFDPNEFYRRPDARTMTLLTSQILNEVEQALINNLSDKLSLTGSGGSSAFNAAQFKNTSMKQSQLSPALIEAALTQIIENLDKYPNVVTALKKGKIGYHDKGTMMNDIGVRTFVIQG